MMTGEVGVPPEVFGEDYLHFYADVHGDERSDADAADVARLLALQPGMRVLDVPCGEGRIAGRLARRGYDVVGVDSMQRFVALARRRYPEAVFERGDMRDLSYEGGFDAVVNWFTSFGYFDPATNNAVLASFARALRPGGQLLLELHNPTRLARLIELAGGSAAMVFERDGDLLLDRVTYDQAAGRSHTERFVVRDGRVRRLEFSLEQVPAPQLIQRLRAAGFGDVQLFGRGGEPFRPEGPRMIALARLPRASGTSAGVRRCEITIRHARAPDWPAIWAFMHPIVAAGETFSWHRDTSEAEARTMWFQPPPGATLVAVDDPTGRVIGTAVMHANHGGPGSHVATASFMVDAGHSGRGAGRALGEAVIARARRAGFRGMQFNAVAETNTRAVALWQSLGFQILATVPGGFRHPAQGFVGRHIMYRSLLDD